MIDRESKMILARPLNCLVGYCDSVDALPPELRAWGEQLKCYADDLSDAWDKVTTESKGSDTMTKEEVMALMEDAYFKGMEDAARILLECVDKRKKLTDSNDEASK